MFRNIHPNRWLIWCIVVVFCVFVLIWWQINLFNLEQEQSSYNAISIPTRQNQETVIENPASQQLQNGLSDKSENSGWKSYISERQGVEFKYPQDITFDEGDNTAYSNFENAGDNFLNFVVWDKVEGRNQMSSLKFKEKNLFAPEEVYFQNGKFILSDGYGTMNYYFVNAYYDGKDYVYDFMMSRPNYSPELLETFLEILASTKLTK